MNIFTTESAVSPIPARHLHQRLLIIKYLVLVLMYDMYDPNKESKHWTLSKKTNGSNKQFQLKGDEVKECEGEQRKTPNVGIEPTTTRLRVVRSAD